MCVSDGGSGKTSLAQLRQGRGMAMQRSVTSNYTDHDYSGVTAYQSSNNKKKFKAVKALDGATVSSKAPNGRGGPPRTMLKFASVQIGDAASYNAAIDAGAKFTGKPVEVTKQSELGRTGIADEASARVKTRKLRSGVANVNDGSTASRSKKRSGLRIDRSTGTNSGGSGVYIPK